MREQSRYTPFALQNVDVVPPLGSRQPVPGTNVSLCPPRDFQWSDQHRAWESISTDARIKVLQFRGQSFPLRKPRLESLLIPNTDNIDRWERKERTHGRYEALELGFRKSSPTLLSSQPELTCHRMLAFGDESVLILCTAHYPAHFTIQEEAGVLAAIHSMKYHPEGIYGHLPAHARFTLDLQTNQLNWIPANHANPNGPFVFRSQETKDQQGMVQVIIELFDGLPESPGESLEALFRQNFFSSYQVLEVQPIEVNGIQGYEAFAIETNTKEESSKLEYVAILTHEDRHLTFHGMAPDDRISHLATFRNLLNSYRPA